MRNRHWALAAGWQRRLSQATTMLSPGTEVVLAIERPAAGGRMIARAHGQIVLVRGTLPGERVRARIERATSQLAYATTVEVLTPSPDRRAVRGDPLCGGCVYSHIAYPRQCALKAEILADAFLRIAKLPLAELPPVTDSPELGYRMRARLHVSGTEIGFYREGTRELCAVSETGQLLPETEDLVSTLADRLRAARVTSVAAIDLAENIPASERALHFDLVQPLPTGVLSRLVEGLHVTGMSWSIAGRPGVQAPEGTPWVTDRFEVARIDGGIGQVVLRRHARAFFQANRYLLAMLAARVVTQVAAGPVVDLYAGVGLFAVSLLAAGRHRVVAVEAEPLAARDLRDNLAPYGDRSQAVGLRVEQYLASLAGAGGATIIVDPPRTGMSREAVDRLCVLRSPLLVFVSCDVATMARDVRRLVDAGYTLETLEGFDLFPNTAHIEALAVLRC